MADREREETAVELARRARRITELRGELARLAARVGSRPVLVAALERVIRERAGD